MKRWFVFSLIIAVFITVGVVAVKKRRVEMVKTSPPVVYPLPVRWATIKSGELREVFRYVGTVKPYRYAVISTKVSGTIVKVFKNEGKAFKKGECLLEIDDSEIRNQILSLKKEKLAKESLISGFSAELEALKVELKNDLKEYEREKFLYERGAVPEREVERLENLVAMDRSKVKSVEAKISEVKALLLSIDKKIDSLKSKLRYTVIRAVESGIVANVLVYEGDTAFPGKALMKVYYPSYGFRLLVNVPPEDAEEIPEGSAVFINGREAGRLVKYYPAADVRSSLYTAEIKLKKGEFKPGENLPVELRGKIYRGQVIPIYAILHANGKSLVLVLEDGGKVKPVSVRVVKIIGDKAVVFSDIPEGTKLAVGRESKLLEILRRKRAVPAGVFNG